MNCERDVHLIPGNREPIHMLEDYSFLPGRRSGLCFLCVPTNAQIGLSKVSQVDSGGGQDKDKPDCHLPCQCSLEKLTKQDPVRPSVGGSTVL